MRSVHAKRRLASVLIPILGVTSSGVALAAESAAKAAEPSSAQQSQQFLDGIAAVVNQKVITLQQVNAEARLAQDQLQRQKIPVPDHAVLQKQVLQRMITEEVERQEAERLGIRVSDAQAEQAVQTVADRNKISVARLREEVEKSGVPWETYMKTLRQEVRMDLLRQRAVDSTIVISDAEIDSFLKSQGGQLPAAQPAPQAQQQAQAAPAQQSGPAVLGLAQILVAVPEGSPASRVQELRKKAEALLARVRGGADFAGVAAASSDDPQALKGGELGVRPLNGWPDLFLQATENLKPGEVSGVIQSGNGFHILKVLTRGQPAGGRGAPAQAPAPGPAPAGPQAQAQGPMMVTQTHARHILIKSSKVMSDEKAETRLNQLRQRLQNGDKFEDLAKRYSEDVSAPQGGDLGWLTPGETVPAFEQAMDDLEPGQISQPVKSQFGWHLIQVLERRTKNMETEFKRMQARQILFQRRAEPAFEDWLNQLRGQAYIDNRLDPQSNRSRR
ncbi:periplasmic chaperone for outer membrane proteins SurA [Pollutimonas bauzanensis]|uniref:Chaperone SurA n=2 Tax=Pollutimonas bauzanensis TaxID=658167 RepID=A0A1M5WWJ4_9BURK|nr:periplasmic chaperone for outer membrane proteins SurA [Pollutimonas bauzanensis]